MAPLFPSLSHAIICSLGLTFNPGLVCRLSIVACLLTVVTKHEIVSLTCLLSLGILSHVTSCWTSETPIWSAHTCMNTPWLKALGFPLYGQFFTLSVPVWLFVCLNMYAFSSCMNYFLGGSEVLSENDIWQSSYKWSGHKLSKHIWVQGKWILSLKNDNTISRKIKFEDIDIKRTSCNVISCLNKKSAFHYLGRPV